MLEICKNRNSKGQRFEGCSHAARSKFRDSLTKLIIKNKTRDTNRFDAGLQQPGLAEQFITFQTKANTKPRVEDNAESRMKKRSEIYRLPYLPNCCWCLSPSTINYDNLNLGGNLRAVAHNFGKLSESTPLDQFLNYMQSIPNAN